MKTKSLKIIPIGGLGEVGRNMMVYEYDDDIIIVDCGLMFPNNDMLGVDYIIPDFQYLRNNRHKIRGLIFTHGHEDHIGAVNYFLEEFNDVPVYATPLTMGLVKVKLGKASLTQNVALHTVQAGSQIKIGKFKVDFFHVCHSIPDSVGLGIETPEGLIVQSGDYKFDHTPVDNWPTDYAKLVEFSKRGVLALIADSTNSTRPGWTPSEQVVGEALDKVFSQAKGRIIVASFASLVSRMQQVVNAAKKFNRKIAFVGTSMVENAKIAQKLGFLSIEDDQKISIEEALHLQDGQVTIMCTGSQGEPTSILGRLSRGTQRQFDIKEGDTVVLSSKTIPGNEEAVFSTINDLFRRGANVIYEQIAPVHVSGHGSQEDIKLLLHLTKPKYFIPAYGELRQLKQSAILAQQTGIPERHVIVVEDGQVITAKNNKLRLGDMEPISMVFVDGSGVGDIGPDEMHDREMLSKDGVILVHVILNKKDGALITDPEIISRGFTSTREADELFPQARRVILDIIKRSPSSLDKEITKILSGFIYRETQRRPTILVTISKI
ncbi:MAG TPA: ribonuclease J [Anaerolineaceae bacterium]|nr:ribonuclease J [Anaerolineaceae bacterium]